MISPSDLSKLVRKGSKDVRARNPHLLSPDGLKSRARAQWVECGGKRLYARSLWEANYARYLEWLKQRGEIKEWEHEPKTFWFEHIKRGVRSYLPDFRVTYFANHHHRTEWHEVKGFFDSRSQTKCKRFRKYYPEETLVLIDSAWFRANGPRLRGIVPGWESGGNPYRRKA